MQTVTGEVINPDQLGFCVMAVCFLETPDIVRGTAFLPLPAAPRYAVTCNHVVAGRSEVLLDFRPTGSTVTLVKATVVAAAKAEDDDIAVLLLEREIPNLMALPLTLKSPTGKPFYTWGFSEVGSSGIAAHGTIQQDMPAPAPGAAVRRGQLRTLQTDEIASGFSGAPLILVEDGLAAGMVTGVYQTQKNIYSSLAFAVTAQALEMALARACPVLPLRKRNQWCGHFGLWLDPFDHPNSNGDPHVHEYYWFRDPFEDVMGKPNQPQVMLVFGPPGSGKTSLCGVLFQTYNSIKNCFAVTCQKFELQTGRADITLADHIDWLACEIFERLLGYLRSVPTDKWVPTSGNYECRMDLDSYMRQCSLARPIRQGLLEKLALGGPNASNYQNTTPQLQTDAKAYFRKLIRCIEELCAFDVIYLLIDAPSADDISWTILKALLQDLNLLESVHPPRLACKFFLDERFFQQALQIPWIAAQQFERVRELHWEKGELKQLIGERVKRCGSIDLGSLVEDSLGFTDFIIEHSDGTPRNVIALCDRLVNIHIARATDEEDALIATADLQRLAAELRRRSKPAPDPVMARTQEVLDLIRGKESKLLEFKSSIFCDLRNPRKEKSDKIELAIAKTICAFANSDGGTLLGGINDDGVIVGLADDLRLFNGEDGLKLAFNNLRESYLGLKTLEGLTIEWLTIDGMLICCVQVKKFSEPLFCGREQSFYVRNDGQTNLLLTRDALRYISQHFDLGEDRPAAP
jgi:hypothetical protein